ncbi:hypothetical protein [Nitratireductor aestuarii]|uniref:hypothetical protein n=1 Tax=Nitratireductor aestuarii TaxID=1735103 RepID=UPI00166A9268|nr:hypothetical protein [Nitratireductor aestuarii]
MFDFQSFEKELTAVLESSIVRDDAVASSIAAELKLCSRTEEILSVFTRLCQRLDEIERDTRSERGSRRAGTGVSNHRVNIRL